MLEIQESIGDTEDFPLVTVAVLSFNTGKFVRQLIDSVVSSGYPNLEVICIDDASTDDSRFLLTDHAAKVGYTFIANRENLGIPENLNEILSRANGSLFMTAADDLLLKNRIWGDVRVMITKPDLSFTSSRASTIDYANNSNDQPVLGSRTRPGVVKLSPRKLWFFGSRLVSPTITFRTKTLRDLGGWDTEFEIEDRLQLIRLASLGLVGWHRAEVTTLYRRHAQSLGGKFRDNYLTDDVRILEKYKIRIPRIVSSIRFIGAIHYSLLVNGSETERVVAAIDKARLDYLLWTIRSKWFRRVYFLYTFFVSPEAVSWGTAKKYLK